MTATPPPPSLIWFQPGDWVSLQGQEDWGVGQVQTVVGSRVTVNFENAGKQLLDVAHAILKPAP
ncbi:MAG: DUF3553 domain-containing protein [Pseudomonadota bacterium]